MNENASKWEGKNKAVTFSYDDGVQSDVHLMEILNKYQMKATLNLNSGLLGQNDFFMCNDFQVRRLSFEEMKDLYTGHEIAVHGKYHSFLTGEHKCESAYEEFAQDKQALEKLFGQKIHGMAYAYGQFDDSVVAAAEKCDLKYARTVWDSHDFQIQQDLLRFRPTCHHNDEHVLELCREFTKMKNDRPALLYIWGHSYEFDGNHNWNRLEEICEILQGSDDIYFGTNSQVLL